MKLNLIGCKSNKNCNFAKFYSLLLVVKKVSENNSFNMKLKLFLILATYLVISFNINVFFYGKSHLYVANLQKDIINQVPEQFYQNSWKVFEAFHFLKDDTPTEIQKVTLSYISMVASVIKNACETWNDPSFNKYKSCKFSESCSLHRTLEKMLSDKSTTEKYLSEIQEIFDMYFDYWDFFLLANRADREVLSQMKRFAYLKTELQGKSFKKLHIHSHEKQLKKEMKNAFNTFLDLIETYHVCLEEFPELEFLEIKIGQFLNDQSFKINWNGLDQEKGISVSEVLPQVLNQIYLQLCLNNHQMIYINSILSVYPTICLLQVCIAVIFCIFPKVPLWIVLTFEIAWHYFYGKIFRRSGNIRERLPMLTFLLSTRTQHFITIPRFDTMRMYKRRRRKILTNR